MQSDDARVPYMMVDAEATVGSPGGPSGRVALCEWLPAVAFSSGC